MPDTITPSQPVIPDGSSPEQVFAAFQAIDPALASTASGEETKPEPAKPAAASEKKEPPADGIPEQFLTGKKDDHPQPEDEYEKMMSEDPKGQLKHDDWKRYKAAVGKKVDALTAQIREREAKLSEAEKRGVPAEIDSKLKDYESKLKEYESMLERVAVQESPKFKSQFTVKEVAIQERLKRSGAELGLDVDSLDMALKSSPKRRAEILDQMEMGETARSSLAGLMNQFDLLQDDKTEFLNQSKEVHAKWQEEQKQAAEAQEQQRSAFEKQVFTKIGEEIRATYAPFQRVEGNDAWNAQAQAMEAEAEKYFNGQLPLEDLARVVYKGVGAVAQEKIIAALHKKLSDATTELASLKKAQPGSNGQMPHSNGAPDDRNMPLDQRATNTWNRFVGGQ